MIEKLRHPEIKLKLHPRNKHRGRYDFKELSKFCPQLAPFVRLNIYGDESIDFSDPQAVKMLNKALLKQFYKIDNWDIPPNYLCPPIPGRADYIHYIADLLAENNGGKIPKGRQIKCLDIGVGANCIYPIIGNKEYGWSFVGADVDPVSIASANKIIEFNPSLKPVVELRLQKNPQNFYLNIIQNGDIFDLAICNPPFHASMAEAKAGTLRKLSNLKNKKITKAILNFGGQNQELWIDGGEAQFVRNMIEESQKFKHSCFWFSTNISKQSNLKAVYAALKTTDAAEVETIEMGQGNKVSRIVAWTFLTKDQQKVWKDLRWRIAKGDQKPKNIIS